MKKLVSILMFLALLAAEAAVCPVSAQLGTGSDVLKQPRTTPFEGLPSPNLFAGLSSRLTLRNSLVLGYSSAGAGSGGFGYYLSSWQFDFDSPVKLNLEWALPITGVPAGSSPLPRLQNALFMYNPRPGLAISFQYRRYPRSRLGGWR